MRKYIVVAIILLSISVAAFQINSHDQSFSYDNFSKLFKTFKKNFTPTEFTLISPQDTLLVTTASLPNTKIDERKTDALKDDLKKPTRYELYYKDKNSNLLVKVNFIFNTESRSEKFLGIHAIGPDRNSNIISKYENIPRPLFDEFLINLNGYIVLINFIQADVKIDENEFNIQKDLFYQSVNSFYSEFEEYLLKTEEN